MGIRRVTELNVAGGIKLFWRFCSSNKLWAKWIRAFYLKESSMSSAKASLLDSGTWKLIIQYRELAMGK